MFCLLEMLSYNACNSTMKNLSNISYLFVGNGIIVRFVVRRSSHTHTHTHLFSIYSPMLKCSHKHKQPVSCAVFLCSKCFHSFDTEFGQWFFVIRLTPYNIFLRKDFECHFQQLETSWWLLKLGVSTTCTHHSRMSSNLQEISACSMIKKYHNRELSNFSPVYWKHTTIRGIFICLMIWQPPGPLCRLERTSYLVETRLFGCC